MPRHSTPPRAADPTKAAVSPPTPEVTRRIEENRLRAKARREAYEAEQRAAGVPSLKKTPSGFIATEDIHIPNARKRAHDEISSVRTAPSTSRDGRMNGAQDGHKADEGAIRPLPKFTKFVDYDFDKITDTKGGFLSAEDDPWNKAMSGSATASTKPGQPSEGPDRKPEGMTVDEWERLQILKKLRRQKAGPFEPGLSVLQDEAERKKCRECGSLEIDFVWEEVFHCNVCNKCKEAHPDKYSLLTKTECKEDYLLTDPELRDPELLPHLARPNPHKSHWHDMMLFLRFQVEEYAFGDKKWGSAEALDDEFQRREADKKKRKEEKFKAKLLDLKKRTRTEAYRREHGKLGSSAGIGRRKAGEVAKFGDAVPTGGKHTHEWGRAVENEDGMTVKTCTSCGMEVEELEF
ncbi:XPA protein C-terminus-domain-containing protein [Xylariales sp. PMI_506]|nr:XPA protein C-terminus-domain-containing protein [Xylariales sp. PMI_506]